jgi:hypothetical protein
MPSSQEDKSYLSKHIEDEFYSRCENCNIQFPWQIVKTCDDCWKPFCPDCWPPSKHKCKITELNDLNIKNPLRRMLYKMKNVRKSN